MARNGKIARLPLAVRNQINQDLLENKGGPEILARVNTSLKLRGPDAITPQNLSEWRAGGFADWLEKQDKVERIQQLSEFALRLADANGGSINAGAAAVAGGQLLEILESFDTETQKAMLAAAPENYFELLDKLSKLQRSGAEEKKVSQNDVRLQQNDRKLALEEQRFRRQTAELFLKFYTDKKAKEIVEGAATKEVKIEQLKLAMVGEDPNREDSNVAP